MQFSPEQVFSLLEQYRYLLLLPLATVEGPIVTVIAGFLASLGILNIFAVYFVSLAGDIIGDSFYYSVGRFGINGTVLKIVRFLGLSVKRVERVEEHFKRHAGRTIFFGKLAYGLETMTLMSAGLARVPYLRFVMFALCPSIPKSLLFVLIGYYFGSAYVVINRYLDNAGIAVVIILPAFVLMFIIYRFVLKKLRKFV